VSLYNHTKIKATNERKFLRKSVASRAWWKPATESGRRAFGSCRFNLRTKIDRHRTLSGTRMR